MSSTYTDVMHFNIVDSLSLFFPFSPSPSSRVVHYYKYVLYMFVYDHVCFCAYVCLLDLSSTYERKHVVLFCCQLITLLCRKWAQNSDHNDRHLWISTFHTNVLVHSSVMGGWLLSYSWPSIATIISGNKCRNNPLPGTQSQICILPNEYF
jgi:hypothetical protein